MAAAAATMLATRTLPLNADVAEWCVAPQHSDVLAAGTYQLDEAAGVRQGRVHLYSLSGLEGWRLGSPAASTQLPCLTDLSTLDLPGVFDLRWHPTQPLLAAALADGSLRVLALVGGGLALQQAAAAPPLDGAAGGGPSPAASATSMALSLDWGRCSPTAAGGTAAPPRDSLVASYSCGRLQRLAAAPGGLTSLAVWRGHELEAWVAAADAWSADVVYSGGDDGVFAAWDARAGCAAPAWADRRAHAAGVCCVAASPHAEHLVATGSYDEAARLWDLRAPRRPLAAAAAACGGGVWRLKWHPSDPRLLLAACMHDGFKLLAADAAGGALAVAEEYAQQRTLAYGADWCRAPALARARTGVVATASFYDRQLHVWAPATMPHAPTEAVGGHAAEGKG